MNLEFVPADTLPEAAWVQLEVFRRMSGDRRLQLAFQMSSFVRDLVAAGVRSRHPHLSEQQVKLAVLRQTLGDELFHKVHPEGKAQPMTQETFLTQVARFLETAGIPFMVAGSVSSSFYGHPRATNDVDLVIDPTAAQLDSFLALLGERFYASREAAQDALRRRSLFNIIDFEEGWKADSIIRKDRPFSIEEFKRRQMANVQGQPLPFASPEDVILSKLEWRRLTPSERQLQDALNVAVAQWSRLDQTYLRHWAPLLGVTEALEEVLLKAGEAQPRQPPP